MQMFLFLMWGYIILADSLYIDISIIHHANSYLLASKCSKALAVDGLRPTEFFPSCPADRRFAHHRKTQLGDLLNKIRSESQTGEGKKKRVKETLRDLSLMFTFAILPNLSKLLSRPLREKKRKSICLTSKKKQQKYDWSPSFCPFGCLARDSKLCILSMAPNHPPCI